MSPQAFTQQKQTSAPRAAQQPQVESDARSKLKGTSYEDGKRMTSPGQGIEPPADAKAAPAGLPENADDVKQSIDQVGVSVTDTKGDVIGQYGPATIKILPGTRLHAGVGRGNLHISAQPGLYADVNWAPDATINSLTYDFATASFRASAEGLGPDGLYSKAASWAANRYFKPKLPAAMQKAGYDPKKDPDGLQTLKELGGLFDMGGGGGATGEWGTPKADKDGGKGGVESAVVAGLHQAGKRFTDPGVDLSFHLLDEVKTPLMGGEAELVIAKGTSCQVFSSFKGPVDKPVVSSIDLRAHGKGIEIHKTKGFAASIQGLEIHSVRILPGGKVKFEYDLIPEQLTDGVVALFTLFAAAAGDRSALNRPMPRARFEEIRKDVDKQLEGEAGPALVGLIRQYDKAIPGMSLVEAFGL